MKAIRFTTTKTIEHNGKTYVVKNTFRDYYNDFRVFNNYNKNYLTRTGVMYGDKFIEWSKENIIEKSELERAIKEHQALFERAIGKEFENDDLGFFKYFETPFDTNNKNEKMRHWIRTTFYEKSFYERCKAKRY